MSRRLAPLAAALLAVAAAPDATSADEGEIAWAAWLGEADVWELPVTTADAAEPAALDPASDGSLRQIAPPPDYPVQRIPVTVEPAPSGRIVRYEVPLDNHKAHAAFAARGLKGELIAVPVKAGAQADSTWGKYGARLVAFFGEPDPATTEPARVVRYEAPADDIAFHTEFAELRGEIIEPGMLRLPEVRFFQPKARVFMDLKRSNDEEFDLFADGSVLASLDVVELYFPMPLVSERFARTFGRPSRLSRLGWRVGGTVGIGITTALTDGDGRSSGSPISTLSAGLRYDFPLGPPSQEVLATGDFRLDQRTRVGIEGGVQGGLSTDESISESTDVGLYLGILVNTPWGG